MNKTYVYIISIIGICLGLVLILKHTFFNDKNIGEPIKNVIEYYNKDNNKDTYLQAVYKPYIEKTNILTENEGNIATDEEEELIEPTKYPYSVAPTFDDDGSIIYDGMTITELTEKLNKSLNNGYLYNTGYFFADFTRRTGYNPYLAVAVTFAEAGCNNGCVSSAIGANNFFGMLNNSRQLIRYDSLDEGLNAYFNTIYTYYLARGYDTVESFASKYNPANQYAYAQKLNYFIDYIKNK